MRWCKRFVRLVILRKYWVPEETANGENHLFPNRDLRQHEALDCWCGPAQSVQDCGEGDCWHVLNHSLDGRELKGI
jgi:hypothetical protein